MSNCDLMYTLSSSRASGGDPYLTRVKLSSRFGCQTKHLSDGEVTEARNYLFEIDKLVNYREELKVLLGYLNTAEIGEKKELK